MPREIPGFTINDSSKHETLFTYNKPEKALLPLLHIKLYDAQQNPVRFAHLLKGV
jgi:hypothetical protein